MLTPQMAAVLATARHLPLRLRARSVTLAGLAARVLWFDDQIAKAFDAGIDQVVVVGAGYDSRAWRLRREGVRFFEVDHPVTQEDKRRRAPGYGPTYVEADLRTQSAMQRLSACGLNPSRPAIYLFEGVSMYLSEGSSHDSSAIWVNRAASAAAWRWTSYRPVASGHFRTIGRTECNALHVPEAAKASDCSSNPREQRSSWEHRAGSWTRSRTCARSPAHSFHARQAFPFMP